MISIPSLRGGPAASSKATPVIVDPQSDSPSAIVSPMDNPSAATVTHNIRQCLLHYSIEMRDGSFT